MVEPIIEYKLTEHGKQELQERNIREEDVRQVLWQPKQRKGVRAGRDVLQRRIKESGKEYLIRIFVDIDRNPAEVVTGYKTSKMGKYWEG